MARSKKEAGAEFIKRVLAHVPKEKQDEIKALIDKDEVAEDVGEFGLLRDDYSRGMDTLKENQEKVTAYFQQLNTWYEEKASDLQKGTEALEQLDKLSKGTAPAPAAAAPAAPPSFDPSKFLGKEEAARLMAQNLQATAQEVSGYAAYLANLGLMHLHDFGEPLDVVKLDQVARTQGKRLDVLYEELTRDKRTAKLEAAAKKHEEDLRKQIRDEVTEELRKNQPLFPYPGSQPEADPLGNATLSGVAKDSKDSKDSAFGVQAAVDEFYRMKRGA